MAFLLGLHVATEPFTVTLCFLSICALSVGMRLENMQFVYFSLKEMENSRLFRLLCKMGCINERPE
jgi:hypothetical protein